MKRNILLMSLASVLFMHSMEKPPAHVVASPAQETISKKEFIELIKKKDAHGVHQALEHKNAKDVVDDEIRKIAQENHTEKSILSRSGSIVTMINQINTAPEKKEKKSSLTSSVSKSRKSTKHRLKKQDGEIDPKQNLLELVKKQDMDGLSTALASSHAYFVDTEILSLAQAEVQKRESSLALAQTIAKMLERYTQKNRSEKRKSRILS